MNCKSNNIELFPNSKTRAGIVGRNTANGKLCFFSPDGNKVVPAVFDHIDSSLDSTVALYYRGVELFLENHGYNPDPSFIKNSCENEIWIKDKIGNHYCCWVKGLSDFFWCPEFGTNLSSTIPFGLSPNQEKEYKELYALNNGNEEDKEQYLLAIANELRSIFKNDTDITLIEM